MGMSGDTADLGLGGGYWVLVLQQVKTSWDGDKGAVRGGPDSYKKLIQGQSEQTLPPPPPPTPHCPDR